MYPADRKNAPAALAVLAVFALAATMPVAAKSTDRQQPMDVKADSSSALLEDGAVSTLQGNVEITQGTLRVHADAAEIHQANGDIRQVVLTGTPARLRQVADNGEATNATANRIVYTLSDELMVLTGNVVITQPRGNLRGETVKYDINTGRLDGGGDGSRVSLRILPRNAAAAPPAEPAPTDSTD
jgi:lipopolysaccharide export system protein LptA